MPTNDEQLQLLRFAVEYSADTVFQIAPDARIIYVNEAGCKRLGYTFDELTRMKIHDLDPDYPAEKWPEHWRQFREKKTMRFETAHYTKSGTRIPVEVSANHLTFGNQELVISFIRDISERKKTEERLRNSQAQLSNALTIARLAPWEYDVANDQFLFNDNFYTIFRTTAEKAGGYTMSSSEYARRFVHPDDASLVTAETRRALETTDPHFSRQLEHRILYADGETGYITVRFFVVKDENGKTVRTYGVNQDITERKRAEESLRELSGRFSMALDVGDAGVWEWRIDQDDVRLDDRFHTMLGYTPGELPHSLTEWLKYHHPDDLPVWMAKAQAYLRGESPYYESEHRIRAKNGEWNWVFTRGKIVKASSSGSPEKFVGIAMNITERKKTEEALIRSEERFRDIAFNVGDWIWETDDQGRYIYNSPAVVKILGYEPAEMLGKFFYDFFVPEEREQNKNAALAFFSRKEKIENFINRNVHKNGRIVVCATTANPLLDTHGNLTGYRGVDRDITEIKKIEESQRLAQLGQMVSIMAHEVNNPVMIISGNAQLAMLEEVNNENVTNHLKTIFKECLRTKNIIQRLLSFSRPSKGKPGDVDVNAAVESVLKLLEHQYSLDNIVLKREFSADLPTVTVDEQQIHEVFMNLFTNAKDAMTSGGTLTINTGKHGGHVKIDIRDTGAGMSPENLNKLFTPFYTTKEKGTGLGLSICRGIIKLYNGELSCKSEPGKGTTFTILLPARS